MRYRCIRNGQKIYTSPVRKSVPLTLPRSLLAKLDKLAEAEKRDRSHQVEHIIEAHLDAK